MTMVLAVAHDLEAPPARVNGIRKRQREPTRRKRPMMSSSQKSLVIKPRSL
jgi:hypothetical protein